MGVDGTGVFPQKNVEGIFRCGLRSVVRVEGPEGGKVSFFRHFKERRTLRKSASLRKHGARDSNSPCSSKSPALHNAAFHPSRASGSFQMPKKRKTFLPHVPPPARDRERRTEKSRRSGGEEKLAGRSILMGTAGEKEKQIRSDDSELPLQIRWLPAERISCLSPCGASF